MLVFILLCFDALTAYQPMICSKSTQRVTVNEQYISKNTTALSFFDISVVMQLLNASFTPLFNDLNFKIGTVAEFLHRKARFSVEKLQKRETVPFRKCCICYQNS